MFIPGTWLLSSKNKIKKTLQKENGNTIILLIIVLEKSLQKEQIAPITQYDPWSAGINLWSTQSDLTPRILTLSGSYWFASYLISHFIWPHTFMITECYTSNRCLMVSTDQADSRCF